jgi:hypothetical protein
MTDPNRNADVINIPNSVNTPFSIQSDIVVFDPLIHCVNNSVVPSSIPVFLSAVDTPYVHNPAAFDPDGDSLSFELVPCNSNLDTPAAGYTYPPGLTINSLNGEIKWSGNTMLGTYNVAVKITEWRHQLKVGYVIRDFEIIVTAAIAHYHFGNTNSIPVDLSGNFSMHVLPNNPIDFSFYFADSGSASVSVSHLEENFSSNLPVFTIDNTIPHLSQMTFHWIPNSSQVRNNPYIFVFRGTSNAAGTALEEDLSFMVFVDGTPVDSCPSFPNFYTTADDLYAADNNAEIFPNPTREKVTVHFNSKWPKNSELNFDVYDLLGNNVYSAHKINFDFQVSLKDLSNGIYIYKFTSAAGNLLSTGKLVKE